MADDWVMTAASGSCTTIGSISGSRKSAEIVDPNGKQIMGLSVIEPDTGDGVAAMMGRLKLTSREVIRLQHIYNF
jgi:hypothetical protein